MGEVYNIGLLVESTLKRLLSYQTHHKIKIVLLRARAVTLNCGPCTEREREIERERERFYLDANLFLLRSLAAAAVPRGNRGDRGGQNMSPVKWNACTVVPRPTSPL
jgi:hypothetical protein